MNVNWTPDDLGYIQQGLNVLAELNVNQGVTPGAESELPRINYHGVTLTLKWDNDLAQYEITDVR